MTEKTVNLGDLQRQRGELQAKLARLDQLINGIEEFGGESPVRDVVTPHRTYPYRGKTMRAAARKCLETHEKEPMTAREVAEELTAGGFKSKSKNLQRLIYQALYQDADFESKDGKWSLKAKPIVLPNKFAAFAPKSKTGGS